MSTSFVRCPPLLLVLVTAAACGTDSTSAPSKAPVTASLTVDASQSVVYVRLGATAQVVTVADALTSSAWDLGFFATNVTVNGGAVGPAGVVAYCLCQNASITDAALKDFTVASQLPAFEAVTASVIPPEASFTGDALNPAISGWFGGSGAAATATPARAWLLRRGATTVTLGKFRVTGVANASAVNVGQVTFEYALQATPGGAFGASLSRSVDVRSGPVYFDLAAGAVSSGAGTWDLRFSGFEIRTNGGVSGTGNVSALVDNGTPYADITAPYAATAPAAVFKRDAYSGIFVSQPWYRYNITGTDNQIWPTFNVYLVRRGTEVYKVQLTGYYGTSGASRQIGIRYARLK